MSYGADIGIVTTHAKEFDALLAVFGMERETNLVSRNGTNYWLRYAPLIPRASPIRIVIGMLNGLAGNTESAITATLLIRNWAPRLICMCGFAAGKKERVKIGDVVVAERVHDNTIKSLESGIFSARSESRGRHKEINEMFKLRPPNIERIRAAAATAPMPPIDAILKHAESIGLTEAHVSRDIVLHDGSIVSDNTLLRDASFFEKFSAFTDEKCRAGEMESAGVTRSAELHNVPWLVVRGISDFGDTGKNDDFQQLASVRAAVVLREILSHIIDLPKLPKIAASEEWTSPNGSLEIEVEQAFRAKKWDAVVELGRLLSRALYLACRYQERVRIGKYVEEAAKRLNRHKERAAALVDDIGWTTVILGDLDLGRVAIEDGFSLARKKKFSVIACKAARHLASVARRQGKFETAATWLAIGEIECGSIANAKEQFDLINRLRLSRAKLEIEIGNLSAATKLVHAARTEFEAAGEWEGPRYAETFLVEAQIFKRDEQPNKAITVSMAGYEQSIRFGRRDEAVENAFFIEGLYVELDQALPAREWRNKGVALATEIGFPIPPAVLARFIEDID